MLGSRRAARAARFAMDFAGDRLWLGSGISPRPSSAGFSPRSPIGKSPQIPSSARSDVGSAADTGGRRSNESDRPSFGALLENHGIGVGQGSAEAERVRLQARKALVRGVGWLLGADESEIDGP